MYKIYKHTNKINGKCYIGQTIKVDSKYRWGPNGNGYERQPKFWNAIQKYGWENFEHEILKNDIETAEDAAYWEAYFIDKYDSINNGYNNHEAGVNGAAISLWKPVYQYDLAGNFIKKFDSLTQAWEETNIAFGSISKACDGKLKSAGNSQWRWDYAEKIPAINRNTNAKRLYQYDLDGNLVAIYNSGVEAEEITGINRATICGSAKKIIRTAGNFVWRYEDDKFSLPAKKQYIPNTGKAVDQLDIDGNYIKTFPSIAAAAFALNLQSSTGILACCKNKRNFAGGYKWQYHNTGLKESLSMTIEEKIEIIDNFIQQIYELRKKGLQLDGEWGMSNSIFREFRNKGYLDNLKELKNKLIGKALSLESLQEAAGSMEDAVKKFTKNYTKTSGQMICNKGAQTDETKKLLKAKYKSVRVLPGKGGKFIVKFSQEDLTEDTVKQGNHWVNKGKDGVHGKFKTKKAADAQRKAMFAQGYKESINEIFTPMSAKTREKYRILISRLTGEQPLIFDNYTFELHNIKAQNVDSILAKLNSCPEVTSVIKFSTGKFDFNTIPRFGQLPNQFYTIRGTLSEEIL